MSDARRACGGNVESPGFAGRHGLPVFGTVGMHVLGYPRKWIAKPYEFQGERLLTRLDELRARIDQRDPRWYEPISDATLAFRFEGRLPRDELVLEPLLADAELDLHRANRRSAPANLDGSVALALVRDMNPARRRYGAFPAAASRAQSQDHPPRHDTWPSAPSNGAAKRRA